MIKIEITFEGVNEPQILLHILTENDEYFHLMYIKSWYRYMTNLQIAMDFLAFARLSARCCISTSMSNDFQLKKIA